jgi:hypothetical protein
MTLLLSQPIDMSDPLLLTDLTGIAAHPQDDRYFAEIWQRVKVAVQLREPHLTAQLSQYNAIVDDRFDWDAQVQEAA